jgi:hypothetical protein
MKQWRTSVALEEQFRDRPPEPDLRNASILNLPMARLARTVRRTRKARYTRQHGGQTKEASPHTNSRAYTSPDRCCASGSLSAANNSSAVNHDALASEYDSPDDQLY